MMRKIIRWVLAGIAVLWLFVFGLMLIQLILSAMTVAEKTERFTRLERAFIICLNGGTLHTEDGQAVYCERAE